MKENKRKTLSQNEYEDIVSDETTERRKIIWAVSIGGIILLVIVLLFVLGGESSNERGEKYLKQKQYAEALTEFQQVELGDKEFRMAQSKINYINGLRAYNDGLKAEAKTYLMRVEPTDEYYNEARLMVEKIDLANKQENLEELNEVLKRNKDTVVIQEKIIDNSKESVNEAQTDLKSKVDDKSKIYTLTVEKLIKGFESEYRSARSASVSSKKESIVKMDSIYNMFLRMENSEVSPVTAQLKDLTTTYMQKRMDYIQQIATDNSNTESSDLRSLKEEADKIYNVVITQINKEN